MSNITNIKSYTELQELVENSDKPILVDFWATWCGPCKAMNPIFEELSMNNDKVIIAKVDVDDAPELAQKYSIMSIPTVLTFTDKNLTPTGKPIIGAVPKQNLESYINQL